MPGFCIFGEEKFFLEIVLKTKYLCIALGMWECSYFELRKHKNHAFSSCFVVIYDLLSFFYRVNGLLRDCSRNQVYLLSGGNVGV